MLQRSSNQIEYLTNLLVVETKCEKYRLIRNYGSWIDITWQSVSGRWQQLETKWFKQDRVTMTASTVESLHVCGDDRPLSNYVESLIRRK
jgi:hypothetical protein